MIRRHLQRVQTHIRKDTQWLSSKFLTQNGQVTYHGSDSDGLIVDGYVTGTGFPTPTNFSNSAGLPSSSFSHVMEDWWIGCFGHQEFYNFLVTITDDDGATDSAFCALPG